MSTEGWPPGAPTGPPPPHPQTWLRSLFRGDKKRPKPTKPGNPRPANTRPLGTPPYGSR